MKQKSKKSLITDSTKQNPSFLDLAHFQGLQRDARVVKRLLEAIQDAAKHPWVIMEVCGGQTHAILRHGIDQLLPAKVQLVHGPGCPVCVTPVEIIDRAISIARRDDVIFCSFGDMLRVPGSQTDLLQVKAAGGDVRTVYSPLDALSLARKHSDKKVVFFAVGFETTAPTTAMAVLQAQREGLNNFFLLVAHVLVAPAMVALLQSPENRVQAYLAAGHVCTVTGWRLYEPIAEKYHVPIVVTGFEPVDILQGIVLAVRQLEKHESRVENAYARSVRPDGNPHAKKTIEQAFRVCDRSWRGLGLIPQSGLELQPHLSSFDATILSPPIGEENERPSPCISGLVLRGLKKPDQCPAFAKECTPLSPLGAPMVSAEGACAAYYAYHRNR